MRLHACERSCVSRQRGCEWGEKGQKPTRLTDGTISMRVMRHPHFIHPYIYDTEPVSARAWAGRHPSGTSLMKKRSVVAERAHGQRAHEDRAMSVERPILVHGRRGLLIITRQLFFWCCVIATRGSHATLRAASWRAFPKQFHSKCAFSTHMQHADRHIATKHG
jgi:hypothetical protein